MKFRRIVFVWIALIALGVVPAIAAFQAEDATKPVTKKARKAAKEADTASQTESTGTETAKKTTSVQESIVPASEIAAAKASGKVWVNTESGVYHKGGKWYGTTKQGKFMTEQDALKAGYRSAKTK